MRFDVKCVRDFLKSRGYVYTVRKFKYQNELSKADGIQLYDYLMGVLYG